jgi:DNA mismatch repair protein MutS
MNETPLMRQYNSIKARHPNALLLFRVGDFYETFCEDAIITSRILGIVLTKRSNGAAADMELAGFPYHALDTYLPKLVRAGQRVAICDQLEDPKMTKTIVKRGVTELVTPGIAYNEQILEQKENNFLAAVYFNGKTNGIAFLDISTGEFFLADGGSEYADNLLQGFKPSEVILQRSHLQKFKETFGNKFYTTVFEDWVFKEEFGMDLLLRHFGVNSLKGFGVENLKDGIVAAGAVMHYLSETHHNKLQHICKISRIDEDLYVWLDRFTIRNLELIQPMSEDGKTLSDVLDFTASPMGARLLKRWIILPVKDIPTIEHRLDIVEYLFENEDLSEKIYGSLKTIGDMERLIARSSAGRISPREMTYMKRALIAFEEIKKICQQSSSPALSALSDSLNPCATIRKRIQNELTDDPPALVNKGNVIKKGVNQQLDELRDISHSGKNYLANIQRVETQRTGISSLRIGYNNVFGYYLEVTNTHKDKVPQEWIRKQTLVNAERYITNELKEYEEKILGAEEKIIELETKLFNELVVDRKSVV